MLMGPFFCTKNEKIDFEEKKIIERFGVLSFFYLLISMPVRPNVHTVMNSTVYTRKTVKLKSRFFMRQRSCHYFLK